MNMIFDGNEALVKMPNTGPNYHSRVKGDFIHPFRESIEYAVRLFDDGNNIPNARRIVKSVISQQNKDEHSPYYGLWPYYLEESLDEMSPPDFNWADFIGKQLLVIYIDHADCLNDDDKEKIKAAVYNACRCIIRRNERVSYTNIAMMDSFVCAAAGEIFGWNEFFEYGSNKLRRLLEFTRSDGNISEYNSPVYTLVALGDANWLRYYVRDAKMKKDAETFYKYLWQSLAVHYHVQTGELSGPQSRNYSTFLTDLQKNVILCAAGIKEFDESVHKRDRISVPKEYRSFFTNNSERYDIVRISNGFCYPCFANSKVEVSYIAKDFCMGSFHHEEMWNQTRPLLGFFGDENNKYSFRIQVLHDGYDFSDAEIHTAQHYGSALSTVNFATDRGDTHICLDFIKNNGIKAHDIRVRFKIMGDIEKLGISRHDNAFQAEFENVKISFKYVRAEFDNGQIRTELTKTSSELCFDCILYSGNDKDIVFASDLNKYCVYTIDVNEDTMCDAVCNTENNRLNVKYKNMTVSTYAASVPFTMLNTSDVITIDGKNIEDLAVNKLDIY